MAENIIKKLNEFDIFENLNIAGPGFINISIKDEYLFKYLNEIQEDISKNIIIFPHFILLSPIFSPPVTINNYRKIISFYFDTSTQILIEI